MRLRVVHALAPVCARFSALVALLAFASGPRAGAEEDERPAPVTRIHPVGALTVGRPDFDLELPPIAGLAEERPLFGDEGGRDYPIGTVDEVIEHLRARMPPGALEEAGTHLSSLGEVQILVRARPEVHAAVRAALSELEAVHLTTVTLDVRAVRLDAATAAAVSRDAVPVVPDGVAAALLAAPGGQGLSLTAYLGQRASAFAGTQQTFVAGQDVEVVRDATVSTPVVDVANLGLSLEARALAAGPRHVRVEVVGSLAALAATRVVEGPTGGVHVPSLEIVTFGAEARVPEGAWCLVQAGAGTSPGAVAILLRVRRAPYRPSEGPGLVADLRTATPPGPGPHEIRAHDVGDLVHAPTPREGLGLHHLLFAFEPEPPVPMPAGAPFPGPVLLDLVRLACTESAWEAPASVEVRSGELVARATPAVHDRIAGTLAELRRTGAWTLVTDVAWVGMPAATAEVAASAGGGSGLAAALADPAAEVVEVARVAAHLGARNTTAAGQRVAYVHTYEGLVAEGVSAVTPTVRHVLSGLEVDLEGSLASDAGAVQLDVRVLRSRAHAPFRSFPTPHGDLDLAEVDVFRVSTSVTGVLGEPVVAAVRHEGDRATLLVLTPRLVP